MMHTADRSVERSVETIFTLMDATDLSGEQDVDMMHNLPHRQLDTVRHRRNRRKPGTNSVYHHEGGHNKIDETQDWSVLDDFADEADPEGHCAVRGDAATQGIAAIGRRPLQPLDDFRINGRSNLLRKRRIIHLTDMEDNPATTAEWAMEYDDEDIVDMLRHCTSRTIRAE